MYWIYNGYKVNELPNEIKYFVYCIHYTNGKKYIGKKVVRSEQRMKPLKDMRKNARRVIEKESDWREYNGSSKLTKGLEIHSKQILYLCKDKRTATYIEARELMKVDAPINPDYVNENILGKFYDNAMNTYDEPINTRSLFDD